MILRVCLLKTGAGKQRKGLRYKRQVHSSRHEPRPGGLSPWGSKPQRQE